MLCNRRCESFSKEAFQNSKKRKNRQRKEDLTSAETGSEKTFESGAGEVCGVACFVEKYASKNRKTESWLPYYI